MSVRFAAEAYRGVFMNFGMILQVIVAAGGMGTQRRNYLKKFGTKLRGVSR